MNKYEKNAQLFPAIISAIIPGILIAQIVLTSFPIELEQMKLGYQLISTIVGIGLVSSAIRFWGMEICRTTSKFLFQFSLFKEDETNMPSINQLIYSKSSFGRYQIDKIKEKIREDFKTDLFDVANVHGENSIEHLKEIAGVVHQIRSKTREDQILLNYNIRYGFSRNLFGGLTIAFLMTILICLAERLSLIEIPIAYIMSSLFFLLIVIGLTFVFCKFTAREYSRQLFITYQTL